MNKNTFYNKFETKNGLIVKTRPITSEDAPYLVDIFEHMGPESRYNRFLQTAEHVDMDRIWKEAEKIADISDDGSTGYLAFVDLPEQPQAPVGGARYIRMSSTQAEFAVSVRDDMQSMGIGTHLLRLLIESALDDGVEQWVGTIENNNTPMWALLRKLGYRLERQPEGNYSVVTIYIQETGSRLEDLLDAAADFSPEPHIIW
ncbi:MAG: GNAT family N-acetyltransferase [Candidatus Promineofilum sp.]|nr:GNAT family N-acetyltransferase [Promineifilum sp.]